jgi:hypothetical protein
VTIAIQILAMKISLRLNQNVTNLRAIGMNGVIGPIVANERT